MKSKEDFYSSIAEVSFLNQAAQQSDNNDKIYFKAILLLLCAKLEKYVTDSTKEYISSLLSLNLPKEKLPESFVVEVIKNEIDYINNKKVKNYINNENDIIRSKTLSIIWDKKYKLVNIDPSEFVIKLSNNGTTEIEDLYKKIGFPGIVKGLSDLVVGGDDSLHIQTGTSYSIHDTINSIVGKRNAVIHEDKSPQITQSDIDIYINVSKSFVDQIDSILSNSLSALGFDG